MLHEINGGVLQRDSTDGLGIVKHPLVPTDDTYCRYVRDLKGDTCDDPVYSLPRLRQDFKKMADDGAKMVRIYGPICEQAFVWDNVILAAAENKLFVSCIFLER